MTTPLQQFLEQRPVFTQCHTTNGDAEIAIHLAAWRRSEFPDLTTFVAFVFRYSSALQPYIAEPDRRDLASWVDFDPNADDSAASYLRGARPLESNAHDWFARNIAVIDGDFLDPTSTDVLIVDNDSIYAQTSDWFVHSFVGDLLSAPEPFPPLAGHENDEPWSEDRNFYEILGPESDSVTCKREDCERGCVQFSILCRPHHFESIKGRPSPYTH